MKASWSGIALCSIVLYFGVVHSLTSPKVLLNPHALILVLGGTIAIAILTYSPSRLLDVGDYLLFAFLFRVKKTEKAMAQDLISFVEDHFQKPSTFSVSHKPHPFLVEAFNLLRRKDLNTKQFEAILMDRRNAIKRKYIEDAKILNNIAKYPPHLGLMGAASGMIEMMSALGKAGVATIGASMAVALCATLWGVGLNNFIFLPLSDNSMKVSEDDIYMRDTIINCALLIKQGKPRSEVLRVCFNRLTLVDRNSLYQAYTALNNDEEQFENAA